MNSHLCRAAAAAVALSAAMAFGGAAQAQNIDTTAGTSSNFCNFGVPNTATYGQTITVPAGQTNLASFGFQLSTVPSTVVYRASVYAWNAGASRATGPALYTSAPSSSSGPTIQTVTFTPPGGVAVTPGQQYVLFLSTSQDQGVGTGIGCFRQNAADPYPGGSTVYLNNGSVPSDWTSLPWTIAGSDLGFTATFVTPVPTMSEWAMMLLAGLMAGGAALYVQRRRLTA